MVTPFKSSRSLRLQPKPRPLYPDITLPAPGTKTGKVALKMVMLDQLGRNEKGQLYVGDPDNILTSNPIPVEPQPRDINITERTYDDD